MLNNVMHYPPANFLDFRDGSLENLWGGRASTKKHSRKGKLNEKKFTRTN